MDDPVIPADPIEEHLPALAEPSVNCFPLSVAPPPAPRTASVERDFGFAVARAYAGHADPDTKATTTAYIKAHLDEIVQALAALTGEPHPLAPHDR